jgi:hypothetical protein
MDGSGATIELPGNEAGLTPIARVVLKQKHFTDFMETENGDDKIEAVRLTERSSPDIGDTPHVFQKGVRLEGAIGLSPQPDDAAATMIGWGETTEISNQQVEDLIAVEIDNGGSRGVTNGG